MMPPTELSVIHTQRGVDLTYARPDDQIEKQRKGKPNPISRSSIARVPSWTMASDTVTVKS